MEGSDLLSVGDGKGWPPGFRFHPTDEELIVYYLKRKICGRRLKLDVIGETDVYKWDPEELPRVSKLKSRDRQWYFFSPRDRKYPNGARSNRATRHGYWKATGKDRVIPCNSRSVGLKKTLVFYEGRAPSGKRTDWVMHEYTMDEEELQRCQTVKEYFALYKVYKKSGPGPKNGEQYGAPFREEEWLDDDDEEEAGCSKSQKKLDITCSKDQNTATISQRNQLFDDIDYLLKNGVNDTFLQELSNEFPFAEQVDAERQEIGLSNANQSIQQRGEQCLDDYTQFTNNPHEYSDLTNTVADIHQVHVAQEDPLEDYLEINDLDGSDPAGGEIDGLSILDLYHDAAMFLQDMGPDHSGMVFSSLTDHVDDDIVLQASYQPCLNHMNDGVTIPNSHLLTSDQENDWGIVNSYLGMNNYEPIEDQVWVHNENLNVSTPAVSIEETIVQQSHVSGVVYDGYSGNQSQNQNINRGGYSFISGAAWDLLGSIPSPPASAAESIMVTKGFERISSFSRLTSKKLEQMSRLTTKIRTNSGNSNDGVVKTASKSRSRYNNWGFYYCFSLIGVMVAILWWFVGSSTKVFS